MRILVLSQYWWPENGVPQRRWRWLTSILRGEGHEVDVIAPLPLCGQQAGRGDDPCQFAIELRDNERGPSGEHIYRCKSLASSDSLTHRAIAQAFVAASTIRTAWRLRRSHELAKPDVVIGTVPALPTAVATFFVARVMRVPYVIDLRDAWPDLIDYGRFWNDGTGKKSLREKILQHGPFQLVGSLTKKILKFVYRHSEVIILTAAHLRTNLTETLSREDATQIPRTVTIRNVFPADFELAGELDFREAGGELNVLYAGTLGRAQQLSNAIEAVELATEKGYRINLRLVGKGATSELLRSEASKSNCSVTVLDEADPEELIRHYKWADTALVHLANWPPLRAAVPSKTFELMRIGIHISAAVEGETAELVSNLKAGDVVPPMDPEALAFLWCSLIEDRSRLKIGPEAKEWLMREVETETPRKLRELLSSIEEQR